MQYTKNIVTIEFVSTFCSTRSYCLLLGRCRRRVLYTTLAPSSPSAQFSRLLSTCALKMCQARVKALLQ